MDKNRIIQEIDDIIILVGTYRFVDPQKVLELGEKALAKAEGVNYELGRAVLTLRMGEAYSNIGRYEDAIEFIFNSLDIFVKEGICDLLAGAYILLGIIFTELADYERSMDFYSAAEEIAREIDEGRKFDGNASTEQMNAIILNNVAEIYKLLKDYEEALACYRKSSEIDERLDFRPSRGISLLNLGEMYYILGNYDEALGLVEKSLEYMRLYNYRLGESEAFRVLALTHWKLDQNEKVEEYFRYAVEFSHEGLSAYYEIEVLKDYYEYLKDKGKREAAIAELQRAYNISKGNSVIEKAPEILALLAGTYEEMGRKEEAFIYYKLYRQYEIEYHDSLARQRINSLKARRRLDRISGEKRQVERKNEELRRKSEKLEEIVENISIISELGQKITSTLELEAIVNILYKSISEFMNMNTFGIALYDEEEKLIKPLNFIGADKRLKAPEVSIYNRYSISARCILNKEFTIINDMDKELPELIGSMNNVVASSDSVDSKSAIFCPLIVNDFTIGVMTVQNREKNAFSAYHVEMLKALSAYASIAVNNAIKSMKLEMEIENRKKVHMELELANEKLLYLSENDGLTGIPNRRKFDDFMNSLWHSFLEDKNRIALILLDIDSFKEYNDNYGHVEGDRCIIEIAKVLDEEAEGSYFAARYGGDEFAVVLPKCSLDEALTFGEVLRKKVEGLNLAHGFSKVSDRVTITLGAACIAPSSEDTINEFIRKTDSALYEAKKRGRNQIAGI
ncbi:MAG: GGDEF domain-containing protein [Bacillota bacterium]|nr:GGDEF domain-containing protein [Bacillota bacterium]